MAETFAEFQSLSNARDLAAYQAVGAAQMALAYLNLADAEKAQRILLESLTRYREADQRITEFHQQQVVRISPQPSTQPSKENLCHAV